MNSEQIEISEKAPEHTTKKSMWTDVLGAEKQKPYFKQITEFLEQERTKGKEIYPPNSEIFHALRLTPFEEAKVVIIGQDPYHGPGQAHGLCFSVKPGIPKPPSLLNICKEMAADIQVEIPKDGCLDKWGKQGVLLLNAVLSVEARKAHSHAAIGWVEFTDKIISELNQKRTGLIFLLWGSQAQKKAEVIDESKHTILKAPHPSPLSAHRGFFGCRHFSKTNEILIAQGQAPIDWQI